MSFLTFGLLVFVILGYRRLVSCFYAVELSEKGLVTPTFSLNYTLEVGMSLSSAEIETWPEHLKVRSETMYAVPPTNGDSLVCVKHPIAFTPASTREHPSVLLIRFTTREQYCTIFRRAPTK